MTNDGGLVGSRSHACEKLCVTVLQVSEHLRSRRKAWKTISWLSRFESFLTRFGPLFEVVFFH